MHIEYDEWVEAKKEETAKHRQAFWEALDEGIKHSELNDLTADEKIERANSSISRNLDFINPSRKVERRLRQQESAYGKKHNAYEAESEASGEEDVNRMRKAYNRLPVKTKVQMAHGDHKLAMDFLAKDGIKP